MAVMTRDNTRDVTRDSETDFTLDSEQSTTETDFQTFPLNHSHTPRPESVSPEPTGFRFERNGFYKSTRFRGGAGSVDDGMASKCTIFASRNARSDVRRYDATNILDGNVGLLLNARGQTLHLGL